MTRRRRRLRGPDRRRAAPRRRHRAAGAAPARRGALVRQPAHRGDRRAERGPAGGQPEHDVPAAALARAATASSTGYWEHPERRSRRFYAITAAGEDERERLRAEVGSAAGRGRGQSVERLRRGARRGEPRAGLGRDPRLQRRRRRGALVRHARAGRRSSTGSKHVARRRGRLAARRRGQVGRRAPGGRGRVLERVVALRAAGAGQTARRRRTTQIRGTPVGALQPRSRAASASARARLRAQAALGR